ncbi:MAG: D-alanine--D-alanine ligase family protein, partial [Acidobacteriota bacterium]
VAMRVALTYNLMTSASEAHAEFDRAESIARLAGELAALGHDVTPIDVTGSISTLVSRLTRAAPELVFNLAEGERGAFREAFYPALCEQLGLAHTGSSASTLALCLDKALAKRVVAAAGVRVPGEGPPWIVKPNFEGSSKGITQASVVTDRAQLARALASCRYAPLVEAYVPGIDVAAAWIEGLGVVTPIAYAYEPTGAHAIYCRDLKRAPDRVRPYALDSPAVIAAAERAFDALGVEGYGRADFRVTADGEVYFLEMNPLPDLHDDDLYLASGLSRRELLAILLRPREPIASPRARAS